MTTHRWTSSTRLKRHDTGETIEEGEPFEPTDGELRAFGDHIEEIEAESEAVDKNIEPDAREQMLEETFGEDPDAKVSDENADGDDVPFDEDAWFDDHDGFEDRVETVESGDVDGILDEIEAVERSENVKDAVEARRNELEE